MAGKTLAEQGVTEEIVPGYYSVKEAIFPFAKFQGVDPILGPGDALDRRGDGRGSQLRRRVRACPGSGEHQGAGQGKAFVSVRDPDKMRVLPVAQDLVRRGYSLVATRGTASTCVSRAWRASRSTR